MEVPVFLPTSQILARIGATAFGSGFIAAVDAAAGRSALGLVIGTNVQAYSANLAALSALTVGTSANNLVKLDGSAKLPAVDGSLLTNLPAPSGVLLATGATTGATSQRQIFTNGITGPNWRPASDSTTALQVQTSGGTAIVTWDSVSRISTFNGRIAMSLSDSTVDTIAQFSSISSYNGGSEKIGLRGTLYGNGAGSSPAFTGLLGEVLSSGGAYSSAAHIGLRGLINYQATSGTLILAVGVAGTITKNGAATITTAIAIHARATVVSAGSIGTLYGIKVENQNVGSTNYAIHTGAGDVRLMASDSDKIGFHGVTPVARQLLATGTGATVDNVITLLQNLGLARQS